jgi:hypothetical protein
VFVVLILVLLVRPQGSWAGAVARTSCDRLARWAGPALVIVVTAAGWPC